MSNTVFLGLRTSYLGTKTREHRNPFTDEKIVAHIDNPVSAAEAAAGDRVLDVAQASPPDPEGFRTVRLAEDRCICVAFGAMGAEIHIERGLQADAIAIVFRLASASGMLVTSTTNPDAVAVLPGRRHPGIYERWPTAAEIDSSESLLQWVASEIQNGRVCGPR
jgi:hypothetical protein